jgi:predicted enzyme involved in methoxymalonyl-ACP biosynthesis
VGVAITRDRGEVRELDTFLLSCRVIGRGVETAFLAHLAGEARLRGKTRLEGWFLPTKKNSPACEFYSTHGFQMVRSEPQGALWALDLEVRAPWPEWIERLTPAEAGA